MAITDRAVRRIAQPSLAAACLIGLVLFTPASSQAAGTAPDGELIFHSGYEPGSAMADDGTDITGADQSFTDHNDWELDLDDHPKVGKFDLQYEGALEQDRDAEIIDDATDAGTGNQVLEYWMDSVPEGARKGRIQANVYQTTNLDDLYYQTRWYVPAAMQNLGQHSSLSWLTIAEFWNDEGWLGSPTPFRISVELAPNDGELTFEVHGDKLVDGAWKPAWSADNSEFTLPYDEWLTVEYYLQEGGINDGKFYMAVTRENGQKDVIFAVQTLTRHHDDTTPNGFNGLNPMKMYAGDDVVNYMTPHGGLQWYYDDFELWDGAPSSFDPSQVSWTQLDVTNPQPAPDLDEYVLEYEDMEVSDAQPGHEIVTDPNLSGGAGVRLNAEQVGDNILFVTDMVEGDYAVELGLRKGPDQGIAQFWTLGGDVGAPIDLYSPTLEPAAIDVPVQISPNSTGEKKTEFTVTAKNPDSSGHSVVVDYLKLTTIRPKVVSAAVPDWNHETGESVEATVEFTMPVHVTVAEVPPSVPLTLDDGSVVQAQYERGSGTSELVFSYTVREGDQDLDGIEVADAISLNGSVLASARGRAALPQLDGIDADWALINSAVVRTDPDSGVTESLTTDITAAEDSFVRAGTDPDNPYSDADRNYGSNITLQIKDDPVGTDDRHAYFKFDIGQLRGQVSSAELKLHVAYSTGGRAQIYDVADNGWSENSITWNNKPPTAATKLAAATNLQTGGTPSFDITAHTASLVDGQADWMSLSAKDTTGFNKYAAVNSTKSGDGNAPHLTVAHDVVTEAPMIQVQGIPDEWQIEPADLHFFVSVDDLATVDEVKWAGGERNASYFATGGEVLSPPYDVTVEANGDYTVFVKDSLGNERVLVFHVSKILCDPASFLAMLRDLFGF